MATIAELYDQAVRCHQAGNLREAEKLYRSILEAEPEHAAAHHLLGLLAHQAGQHQAALTLLRRAALLDPANAAAHNNLGVVLKKQGRLIEALACYRQALAIDPRHVDALNNLGIALVDQGELTEAIGSYRQARAIKPDRADTHNNLGIALHKQGQIADAVRCYQQALRLRPEYADAYVNLGNAMEGPKDIAEAMKCYRQALRINPQLAEAHHNLSVAFTRLASLQEALEHNAQALRIDPTYRLALWQRALLNLLTGDFEAGWLDYEIRWALAPALPRASQQPRWDGSPLDGKTIFVYAEGGLGDTIQFVRYLRQVHQRGGKVIFECQPALLGLCAGVAGIDELLPIGAPLRPFDVQAPLLSLPGIFGTTPLTIPAPVPYVRANPSLVQQWKRDLGPPRGFRIGIAWQGDPKYQGDHYRSVPLFQFAALANVKGVALISLQVGAGTEQLAGVSFPIADVGSGFDRTSLDDLAAVLMNLDLVVAVDSAVAHLAGALGVPVWILLPLSPDWRWLMDRADTPWYPSARLFRQTRLGDWVELFERLASGEIPQMARALSQML